MLDSQDIRMHYASLPAEGGFGARCSMPSISNLEGTRILDIGCRKGKGCMKLASKAGPNGFVLGIDWNQSHIEKAKDYVTQNPEKMIGCAHVQFAHAYPELLFQTQVEAETFDVVFANSTINLLFDIKESIAQACMALKPEGRLIIDGVFSIGERSKIELAEGRRLGDPILAAPNLDDATRIIRECMPCSISIVQGDKISPRTRMKYNNEHPCSIRDNSTEIFTFVIEATKQSR